MAERFIVCLHPRNSLLLQNLDIWSKLLPEDCPAGTYTCHYHYQPQHRTPPSPVPACENPVSDFGSFFISCDSIGRVYIQRNSAPLHMDVPGKLLPLFLLRESAALCSFQPANWFMCTEWVAYFCFQLVSSATQESADGAFNFLGQGAGKTVFEIFLNLYIGLLFLVLVCSLGNRPQVNIIYAPLFHKVQD